MDGGWNFVSEDAGSISLHDCRMDRAEERGTDLLLRFDEGFDVTRDNALNPTGRHRNTGPAAIFLRNWRYIGGTWGRGCEQIFSDGRRVPLPETPIPRAQLLTELSFEILEFDWRNGVLTIFADGWTEDAPASACGFCEIALGGEHLLFCWNDLPRDAWFQDWPKK